jgi:hypothetical protein
MRYPFIILSALLLIILRGMTPCQAQTTESERARIQERFYASATTLLLRVRPEITALNAENMMVDNWMGLTYAPEQIRSEANHDTTLVLADDIDLGNRSYSLRAKTAPQNVILIANRIRLSDIATFDLSAVEGTSFVQRSGGKLILIARELSAERNGFLTLHSRATYAMPGGAFHFSESPGNGGQLIVYVEKLTLAPEKQQLIRERIAGQSDTLLPDHIEAAISEEQRSKILKVIYATYPDAQVANGLTAIVRGKDRYDASLIDLLVHLQADVAQHTIYQDISGTVGNYLVSLDAEDPSLNNFTFPKPGPGLLHATGNVQEVFTAASGAQPGLSLWVVHYFEKLQTRLLDAARQKKYVDMILLFRDYAAFPGYPIVTEHQTAYQQLLISINEMRKTVILPLRSRFVTVQREGMPERRITAYSEGDSLENRLAPTHILLREVTIKGRRVLGFYRHNPDQPDETVFYLNAELTVDPWIAELARQELEAQKEQYGGMFTNWNLRARDLVQPGIRPGAAMIKTAGSRIQATLPLDRRSGSLALFQFASRLGGIPLEFDWKYPVDENISGELTGLMLSSAHRLQPEITVSDGKVTNNAKTAANIEYLQVGRHEFIRIEPALKVQPGQTIALPLRPTTDPSQVQVPSEAVSFDMDPMSLLEAFYGMDGEELADEVTLRNALPRADTTSGDSLLYVDVTVSYSIKGNEAYVQTERIMLQPTTAPGSEKTFWFLRTRQGERQVHITGKAYYTSGTSADLVPRTFDVPDITIGKEMLKSG